MNTESEIQQSRNFEGAMKQFLFTLLSFAFVSFAQADGLPLKDGRYPGPVLVFKLTKEQKKIINHFRACYLENSQKMNIYTPYVFALTQHQAAAVKAAKGFSPKRFDIYETYRGFNDAGPHWNLALRFSEDEIELPLDLLLSDEEARKAHEEQGWETTNPCFPQVGRSGAQQRRRH